MFEQTVKYQFLHLLFRKFLFVPIDLLLIAVLLGKNTAAILLHIKAKLPGPLIANPEIRAEIPIEKFHAILLCKRLCRSLNTIMVLIETGQQG